MDRKQREQFILALPKVELHVHLEGTVTPAFWKKLLEKHAESEAVASLASLEQRFRYDSFEHFLHVYRDVIFSFKAADDFYELTRHYLQMAVDQGIRYSEVMMTPWFLVKQGIDFHEMMAEIDRAASEMEAKHPIEMKLIFDGPRNFGKEVVRKVFEMAVSDRTGRVIAVGLGGDEKNYPAPWYREAFDYARAQGLGTIAHAGETAGEQSMLETIQHLKVSRMGHCLGIPQRSELERLIQEREITLDLCPWSNVSTAVIERIEDHPMGDYLAREYPITLNSDDPGMFGNSLLKEYHCLADLHHPSIEQWGRLARHAVQGSFLPGEKKDRLNREIDAICLSIKEHEQC